MWKIVNETNIQDFLDKASSEEMVYKDINSPEKVARYIEMLNRGDMMWWFDAPKFSLHLGVRMLDDGRGKVWMAIPVGAVTGKNASNLIYEKICDIFEELGATEIFAKFIKLSSYSKITSTKGMLQNLKKINTHPAWENTSSKERHEHRFSWRRKNNF